ncbi:hypothetical protein HA402_015798 [Bradysia odoriphaga]|nr:hypothetical protein HA402_015798 [Bradysia odoriphaga]
MTVLNNYLKPTWNSLKLVERSLLSSQKIFLEHMRRNNVIECGMCHVLDEWYRRALEDYRSIYLRTDPSVAYSRVQARARGEEALVSSQYIQEIHNLNEEWIESVHSNNLLHD